MYTGFLEGNGENKMSDADAFMKIGQKLYELEQRQMRQEQILNDIITQLTAGDKNDGEQPKTTNR